MYNECITCGAIRCFKHCNNCGKSIYWKRDAYDDNEKSKMYESGTEIEHYGCMKNGTRNGKYFSKGQEEVNEYILDKQIPIVIYRLGNSPMFKCNFCNHRDDLPRMLGHHLKEGYPCRVKQWELANKQEPTIKIDIINHKLTEFIVTK